MDIYLKGIINSDIIKKTEDLGIKCYSLDLRPKSFNFIQLRKIKEILTSYNNHQFTILFENEKDFMVNEQFKLVTGEQMENAVVEFTGVTALSDLDQMDRAFVWHYHHDEKLTSIEKVSNLKRIVFNHKDLEFYNERGELFGFLNIFNEISNDVDFEVVIDWDTALIESMFDYFQFSAISLEINNKVELSYQNPDLSLIHNQIQKLIKNFM